MASEPILAVDENIDDQIVDFCEGKPNLEPGDVLRDISRIACVANLVGEGTLDGRKLVLVGGMAMRCLDSPRMSVYDADTALRAGKADPERLASAISFDDDPDVAVTAGPYRPGKKLITFIPVTYSNWFSGLPGANDNFSLSVSERGVRQPAQWKRLNHRYPFRVLAKEIDVPIMDPDEILAEKTVAWWLYGHAKHYNDIAFLALRMKAAGRDRDQEIRDKVRTLIETKLEMNRKLGGQAAPRVDRLNDQVRRQRLEDPDEHVDKSRDFNDLAYLHDDRPSLATVRAAVVRIAVPVVVS